VLVGDLIFSVDGQFVHNIYGLQHHLSSLKVGDTVALSVIRGGVKVDLTVILGDRG
jgi:S1-C subfamily serine protease